MPEALEVHKLLPHRDCGDCGEPSCIKFAVKLLYRDKELGDCPWLKESVKQELARLLAPPVKEIRLDSKTLGGEYVLYRHQRRFMNPPLFFIRVSDSMTDEEIESRVKFVRDFRLDWMGHELVLDGLSVESNDPVRVKQILSRIKSLYKGPLILNSFDPEVMGAGLEAVGKRKVIIHGAHRTNWQPMLKLALEYECPLVLQAMDLEDLKELSRKMLSNDFTEFLFCLEADNLRDSILLSTELRRLAVDGVEWAGYPLMNVIQTDDLILESLTACALVNRYASLLVLDSTEAWSLLPLLVLRLNIYSDPASRPTVDSGLYSIGKPSTDSPLLVTSNFTSTYHTLASDLEKDRVDAHVLVVDTHGLAVSVALAAGLFMPEDINTALEAVKASEKVGHNTLILPGIAARNKADLEKLSSWDVRVGPMDSSQIKAYLAEKSH